MKKKRDKKYTPRNIGTSGGIWAIKLNKPLPADEVDVIEGEARRSLDALRLGGAQLSDLRHLVMITECVHLSDESLWGFDEVQKNDVVYSAFMAVERSNIRHEKGLPIGLDSDGLVDIENLIVAWHDMVARMSLKQFNAVVRAAQKNFLSMKWACGDVVRLKEGVA
jgi:hypothetical protein